LVDEEERRKKGKNIIHESFSTSRGRRPIAHPIPGGEPPKEGKTPHFRPWSAKQKRKERGKANEATCIYITKVVGKKRDVVAEPEEERGRASYQCELLEGGSPRGSHVRLEDSSSKGVYPVRGRGREEPAVAAGAKGGGELATPF